MEFIRQWMAQVQAQLSELSVSAKLLIGTLAIVLVVALGVVALYAGRPHMVPVLDQPLTSDEQARIVAHLRSQGIRHDREADRVLVPAERQKDVLIDLQMHELLPADTSRAFDAVVENQTWWRSSEQNRQLYNIAKQNYLSQVIGRMRNVREASVIISIPQHTGFGASARRPSASVNIVMRSGSLDQRMVDAIAGLVSGAVAEMNPEDVTVIDALAGRQWSTREDQHLLPGDYLEYIQAQEGYYRQKIGEALGYVGRVSPGGVIVAVNVEVDLTRRHTQSRSYDRDASLELIRREFSRLTDTGETAPAGEPGAQSNTGVSIAGGDGPGRHSTDEQREAEFDTFAGSVQEVTESPGGLPTRISATVNVPRSYVVALWRQQTGADADTPAPTDEVLAPLTEATIERVRRQVEPLIATRDAGEVVVDVYPDAEAEPVATMAVPAGPPAWLSDSLVQTIALAGLAVASVLTLLLMFRRALRREPPPRPEAVGAGPGDPDLLDDVDPGLEGLELNEQQIRSRKLIDQVSEMVKTNPNDAATLLGRWVRNKD